MTNKNPKLTKTEALQLFKAKNASYLGTIHNKKMMASAVTDFLKTLAANK
tara:strand:- start:5359 stop:5508 length:150 start_codon:yes stop_codon:yes gene_type:complete